MWLMRIPARWFSSSSETCCTVPMPVEEQSSLPGSAFAMAISSGTVRAGKPGWRIKVLGVTIARKTGSSSRCVS